MNLILRRFFGILILSILSFALFAQSKDTIWNQKDKQGRNQGYWKPKYENGNPKFRGFFKDGKPVGELTRYYEDGAVKAKMNYHTKDDSVMVSFYYQNGKLWAEGVYINMEKEGVWAYYSYYSGKLVIKENYLHGLKSGFTYKFFESGTITEELEYKNDMKNGRWNQYYENGAARLKANYEMNMRTGSYLVTYPTGEKQVTGQFIKDKMEGKWTYFDEKGNPELEIMYVNGLAQDEDKINDHQKALLMKMEMNKGKYPEPDETNVAPPIK
jgi:antitoxin component YwqK of YwqJK toxin-antitoxin module